VARLLTEARALTIALLFPAILLGLPPWVISILILLFLAFVLFRIVFWGGMGRHQHWGWGAKGPFPPDGMPSHWREMAERWHREQHGQGSGLKEGETTV